MTIISQPRYLPALTYIQRLFFAEPFVILDNVQRQKRGFENRNRVLVNGQKKWLTIPSKSSSRALISETVIDGSGWIDDHRKKLCEYYQEAPFFDEQAIDDYYGNLKSEIRLFEYDFTSSIVYLLKNLCAMFGFTPSLVRASGMESEAVRKAQGAEKILEIAAYVDSDLYISGLNGREYGIQDTFVNSGIGVKFHADQPQEYDQQTGKPFQPHMAFFDALFYAGHEWVEAQIKKEPKLENE